MRIAVIGAGTAGRIFALSCASAGFHVTLEDVMPAKLRRAQDEYAELAANATGTLRFALTVEDAVHDADLAIDFVPDELESKLEIFSLLDRMAPPRTLMVTPTETLSITDLASCTYRPTQCVGLRGSLTSGPVSILRSRFATDATLDTVATLLTALDLTTAVIPDIDPMLVKNQ
jgi:3-hydroxybutyryl-CoA dehydrogenase